MLPDRPYTGPEHKPVPAIKITLFMSFAKKYNKKQKQTVGIKTQPCGAPQLTLSTTMPSG